MVASKNLETILEAASALFAKHGYHGTSTKAIALAAGVKEPEIYRLFLNKEKLFLDCLTAAVARSIDPARFLMVMSGEEEEGEFSALLRKAVRMWYFSVSPHSARLLMQAALSDKRGWSKLALSHIDKIIGILARRIEKEIHVPKASATAAANSLLLGLFQYKISRTMLTTLEKEQNAVDNMIDQWFRGLPLQSK
ncbi:MAG TPA: helix-turn-helix domain-containing protein [Candidatus Angelobacter sp.]|nr:helix-turn-helix domain-containing protein [Candidatus Angelobacter sp.]